MEVTNAHKIFAVNALMACGYSPHPDERVVSWKNSICIGAYEFITNYCNAFGSDGAGGYMSVILDLEPDSERAIFVLKAWDNPYVVQGIIYWTCMVEYINPPPRGTNWLAVGILATAVLTAALVARR